jgi:uncharacterized protein (TIGR03067 family)
MSGAATPIDGIWELVRAEMDGETAGELGSMRVELELAHGSYLVRFSGKIADRGTFELGGTIELKTMLLQGIEGPNAGRSIPCIYQQVGERLRVCYGLSGITPTDFTTAGGQQRYLATYRRLK